MQWTPAVPNAKHSVTPRKRPVAKRREGFFAVVTGAVCCVVVFTLEAKLHLPGFTLLGHLDAFDLRSAITKGGLDLNA